MATGTNQTGRKALIKNKGSIAGLFLINCDFWGSHRFFVTLSIVGDLRVKHRCLQPITLQHQSKTVQKLSSEIS